MLEIMFNCVESADVRTYYLYLVDVRLFQDVLLARDRTTPGSAATWSLVRFGFSGKKDLHQLDQELARVIDSFANAYLEQNPPHQGATQGTRGTAVAPNRAKEIPLRRGEGRSW